MLLEAVNYFGIPLEDFMDLYSFLKNSSGMEKDLGKSTKKEKQTNETFGF